MLIRGQGHRYGWRGALVLPDEYFTASGPGAISAALNVTDAADTVVSAGVVAIAAALASTDAGDTVTAAGAVAIAAALASTDAADSLVSEGTNGDSPAALPVGGGRSSPAQARASYEHPQWSWEREKKWTREVKRWVETADEATRQPTPDTEATQAPHVTQAAQDAPTGARTPRPAPRPTAAPTPLATLLYRAGELPVAQLLADAMSRGMQDEMVLLAMRAERELQDEEEAIAVLLIGMA